MPLDEFQRTVYLMSLQGADAAKIAEHLGSDVATVEQALSEAEREARENPTPPMPPDWPNSTP